MSKGWIVVAVTLAFVTACSGKSSSSPTSGKGTVVVTGSANQR